MKNHNLRIHFKSGKTRTICHIDSIQFDYEHPPRTLIIYSWGLVNYLDPTKIDWMEATTSKKD